MSGSLTDFAVSQAARTNAKPPCRAIDDRPDGLQIRLEPAGTHVMGMGDGPADHRSSAADFAPLRHEYFAFRKNPETAILAVSGQNERPARRSSLLLCLGRIHLQQ